MTNANGIFQAYVSCALGIHQIGYVMICFGVVNAICSIIFGSIMKYIGRIPIITLGELIQSLTFRNKIISSPVLDQPSLLLLLMVQKIK